MEADQKEVTVSIVVLAFRLARRILVSSLIKMSQSK